MNTPERKVEDQSDQNILDNVAEYGWSVVMVEATDYSPSFAYTIGLWESYNHPEVICFGLTIKTLHGVVNNVGEEAKQGKIHQFYTDHSGIFAENACHALPVDKRNIQDYFGRAIWFYNYKEFPAMQIVWTDRHQRYPWDEGYEEEFLHRQPLLDRNADFKFKEAKNLGIFTTRQWLDEKKPILRVVHDEDGDWQFLTGDQLPDDIRLVALEQMTLRDATLNEVFNLDYGMAATRGFIGDAWVTEEVEIEDE